MTHRPCLVLPATVAWLTAAAIAQAPLHVSADGTAHAFGPRWHATIAPERAAFAVDDGTVVNATLELRYLGWRRDGAARGRTADARTQSDRTRARTRHGDVIECYEPRMDGLEQSFVFETRPAGSGDLVLEIGVAGTAGAAATTSTRQQALEFRTVAGTAIRYGEAIAFARGGSPVPVATRYDGAGRIELVVPAALVDDAHYPLTIDPVVSPILLPAGSSTSDLEPDVAHDVELDRFVVVWRRALAATNEIRATVYQGDGTPVLSSILIASGPGLQAPSVALVRSLIVNTFLVVWQEPTGIRGRVIDAATGFVLAAPFTISTPGVGEQDRRPAVSGPDGAILVAWDRTASGATQPNRILVRDLYWLTAGSAAAVTFGPERLLQSTASGHLSHVRLPRSNVRQQVGGVTWWATRAVWQQFFNSPAPGDYDVKTAAFRVSSAISFDWIQPVASIPGASDVGISELAPDIGVNASAWTDPTDLRYLAVWEESGNVHGDLLDLGGAVTASFPIRATAAFEGAPTVGAGHCEFTVGYLQIVPPDEFDVDVYAARVLRDGTVAEDHSLVDDPGTPFQYQVRASSVALADGDTTERNTSLLAWAGQTGPVGGLFDVRARLFEPVAPLALPFGAACPGPLGELPQVGFAGGDPVPGNDQFAVTVTDAPANALAALLIGTTLINVPLPGAPGCQVYAGTPFVTILGALIDGAGNGQVAVPIPCSMPVDAVIALQWGVMTPGWNAFGWITSDDIDLVWLD